ncbi:MAG: Xaa-Pro dipeptidase, partial [Parasphingorhabdus sp.]
MSALNPTSDLSEIDQPAIQRYRLKRIRQQLEEQDVAGVLLFDPVNIRYANGSRNMQVWTMHNFCRYALILNGGPSLMFEPGTSQHLLTDLSTIDEVLPAWSTDYMTAS